MIILICCHICSWYNHNGIHILVNLCNSSIHIVAYAGLLSVRVVLILWSVTNSLSNSFCATSLHLMTISNSLFDFFSVLRQLYSHAFHCFTIYSIVPSLSSFFQLLFLLGMLNQMYGFSRFDWSNSNAWYTFLFSILFLNKIASFCNETHTVFVE